MTNLTIRMGKRDSFPVVAVVLLKVSRFNQDFRISVSAERRRLHLVWPSAGDPYALMTPFRTTLCFRPPPHAPQPRQRHRSPSHRQRIFSPPYEDQYGRRRHYCLGVGAKSHSSETYERRITRITQPSMRKFFGFFIFYGGEQILGIIPTNLDSNSPSSEAQPLATRIVSQHHQGSY